MKPDEFLEKMKEIVKRNRDAQSGYFDAETAHIKADELMCEVLKELGYEEGIKIFEDMERWYG